MTDPVEDDSRHLLLAPIWHTVVLVAVLLEIAAYGAHLQGRANSGTRSSSAIFGVSHGYQGLRIRSRSRSSPAGCSRASAEPPKMS